LTNTDIACSKSIIKPDFKIIEEIGCLSSTGG